MYAEYGLRCLVDNIASYVDRRFIGIRVVVYPEQKSRLVYYPLHYRRSVGGVVLGFSFNIGDMVGGLHDYSQRLEYALILGLIHQASVGELAALCCQSSSTFKRHFSTRYNMSPQRWFRCQRLYMAHKIIEHTTLGTAEVSDLCGFSSPSRFISQFRAMYGATPRRLRLELERAGKADNNGVEIYIEL